MSMFMRAFTVLALLAVCACVTARATVVAFPKAALAGVTDEKLSNNAANPYPTMATDATLQGSMYTSATLTSGTFTIQGSDVVYSSEKRPPATVQVASMTISNGNVVIQGYFPLDTLLQFSGLSGTVTANTPLIGMAALSSASSVVVEVVDSTVAWSAVETVANTQVLFWIPAVTTSNSAVFALDVDLTRASSVVSATTTAASTSMTVGTGSVVAADYIKCTGCENGIIYASSASLYVQDGGMVRASHISIPSASTAAILNTNSNEISAGSNSLIVVENVSSPTSNVFGGKVISATAGSITLRYVHVNAIGAALGSGVNYAGVTTATADTSLDAATHITSGCPAACLNGGSLETPLQSCNCTCPASGTTYYENFCTAMNDPLASFIPTGCTAGCSWCQNETACNTCSSGFQLDPTTATCKQDSIACPTHCKSCSAAGLCIECDDGYATSSSGACVRCTVANCQHCSTSNPGECTVCLDGADPVNNVCVLSCTDPNCAACPLSINQCTSCKPGYGVVNGACAACADPHCLQCNNDVNTCNSCDDGYTVQGSICSSSDPCDVPDCEQCDPVDPTKCANCTDGKVVDTVTGKCIVSGTCNVLNCNRCSATSASICESCNTDYTLSADNTSCTATATTTTTTTTAPPSCNVAHCTTCKTNDPNTCEYCNTNYYTSNGQCVLTGSCYVGNCAQCMLRDSTKCSNCASGYLISSTFTCLSQHVNVNGAAAPHSLWVAAAVLLASALTYLA